MNERFDVIVTILELIGTAAFAASGALTAIKRRFDLFGVIIIGVTTAVGGGIMRDIVIGSHPVAAFRDPLAMSAAALVSVLVFAALAVKGGDLGGKALKLYDTAMLMLDTIGLGIFTVTGITAAMRSGVSDNTFLLVFSYFHLWCQLCRGWHNRGIGNCILVKIRLSVNRDRQTSPLTRKNVL